MQTPIPPPAHRIAVILGMLGPAFGIMLLSSPVVAQSRPENVPADAAEFEGHWYLMIPKSILWEKAVEASRKKGGYLVCVESTAEREFINGILKDYPGKRLWLGGYRTAEDWRWINGKKVDESQIGNSRNSNPKLRIMIRWERANRNWTGIDPADTPVGAYMVEWSPGEKVALSLPDPSTPGSSSESAKPKPGGSKKSASTTATVFSGNEHANPIELKKTQTAIKGLLVIPLGGSESAGGAAQMNLTARAGNPDSPATVAFNQPVGDSMNTALKEVIKFMELRHEGWARGRTIEIAFEDKYSGKDGPSAAVACSLLLESAFAGTALDPRFAVTGDLNADGTVQPIGGVPAKVRGATNRDCTHVALPKSNETSLVDLVLIDGLKPIAEIQVFSVATFAEALALASKEKAAELNDAIAAFGEIQDIYRRQPKSFAASLRHPKMIAKLKEVLSKAPNHLSASILLSHALGKAPDTLSLQGSVAFIGNTAYKMVDVIDENGKVMATSSFDEDQVADAMRELSRMRLRLDKRTWKWADDLVGFGTLLREWQTDRPSSISARNKLVDAINDASDHVKAERERLMSEPAVIEELAF